MELALEPMDFEPARTCQKALFDAGIPATMGPVTAVMFEDGCGNFIHLVQPAESDSPGGA